MSRVLKELIVGKNKYWMYSIEEAKKLGLKNIDKLPKSMKVLLENLLRHENGTTVVWGDVEAIDKWATNPKEVKSEHEIAYHPARVVMQDFTGVPAVVDLASMREAVAAFGGDVSKINPLSPVDLVIDHSLQVEYFGNAEAFDKNVALEYEQNEERYKFLKWGQQAFKNFRVVPPGTGIIHQVNLEYLAKVVWTKSDNGKTFAFPDTCVGTDSHTTMINGLAVLGWGVGGIEAEAAMLGQPVTMLIPEVVGFKLLGTLPEGVTATDVVLTVTEALRKHGVVNKFVEFYGPGMKELSLADRATLANMAPEYGATCGFFPIDEKTIDYLRFSGRDEETIQLVESYAKAQGLWSTKGEADPVFSSSLELDISTVKPCIAGPSRPQDRINLTDVKPVFSKAMQTTFKCAPDVFEKEYNVEGANYKLKNGDVVLCAITSCTNTSNPSVLMAAGLLAKKARALGLTAKPWVKSSIAPGSKVVTDYLVEAGLQQYLDQLGFNLAGYGCTTCIGNSGPLPLPISKTINANNMIVGAVLSGNRNFEGRISPDIKANFLASPPLVVAYAIAGSMNIDLTKEAIGKGKDGKEVFLKDIWPSNKEVEECVLKNVTSQMYKSRYQNVFEGDSRWKSVKAPTGQRFAWDPKSTYIRNPSFFDNLQKGTSDTFSVKNANILALFGDSVTTDHISPAGNISSKSPAASYLNERKVDKKDFNSYGSRRGNHEVMMRGTFANIRIKNEMLGGIEGGLTKFVPTGEQLSIYDAAMKYIEQKIPLVVIAGKEYGTGSSRDWAAKGTCLLGVKAVVVESFERIHRSNLVGMGIMPLMFQKGVTRKTLNLTGEEKISLQPKGPLKPKMTVDMVIERKNGQKETVELACRIDTLDELNYFNNGGILQYVLRRLRG
ncbi:MAG: aconitate hydratase 1 [Bdellovibrionales bacterium GWA2_49_15]|nr:MAG: aconitate hydratase 1 [Bdellovibrionales bacterium GWA2_49_15]HAZ12324.1 aconitate hydratase AcnA [Bdellovibrionales bacterium]